MKTLLALAFLLCVSVAVGLKCYSCSSTTSAENCDANRQEATCPSGYSCGKLLTEFKGSGVEVNIHAKGCYPQAKCKDAADTILKACNDAKKAGADAKCDFSCCNSDLCNGGTAPVVSVLMMVACVLAAFFR